MVLLLLVDGKKGPNDILVLVSAYNEPLSLAEVLFINKCIMDSEDSYYPISEDNNNIGKAMFLNAINELACDVPFKKVLERYGLEDKRLNIIDKRRKKKDSKGSIEEDVASKHVADFM